MSGVAWASVTRRVSGVALAAAVALTGAFAAIAHADGDPASDYLVSKQVFLTSLPGSNSAAQQELVSAVQTANRAGFAIRVATISTEYDLGSTTELWRNPRVYARFLGLELSSLYRRRLLVIMPNGFGFNWPGHSTAAAYRLLTGIRIRAGDATLAVTAAQAVRQLAGAAGVTLPAPTSSQTKSSGTMSALVLGAAAVVVLLGGTVVTVLAVRRRRRARPAREPREPAVPAAAGPPPRLRWAAPAWPPSRSSPSAHRSG